MVKGVDWNSDGKGCICEVQCYLAGRYGGPPESYTQWQRTQDVYVIHLPQELTQDRVVRENEEWCGESGWMMEPWDVARNAHDQPSLFKVQLKITHFPLEFWHPFFVNMVIAEFGDAYHIEDGNMWGEERAELNAYLSCIDPRRIPFSTALPFNKTWKECYFEVIGWDYEGEPPPESRYQPNENEDARTSLLTVHDKLMYHQTQRSPPPSSSSSTSESGAGAQADAVDQEVSDMAHKKPGLRGQKQAEIGYNRQNGVKRSRWEALSQLQENVAITIGEILVVCRNLSISALFVGTHAVSRHIRSDREEIFPTEDKGEEKARVVAQKKPCLGGCSKREGLTYHSDVHLTHTQQGSLNNPLQRYDKRDQSLAERGKKKRSCQKIGKACAKYKDELISDMDKWAGNTNGSLIRKEGKRGPPRRAFRSCYAKAI